MISICIPVHNQLKYTKQVLENIKITTESDYEICIIDDWSTDWTRELLVYDNNIQNYRYKLKVRWNKWVTKTWNELVKMAKGEYIVVINNDILFQKWWDNVVIWALQDNCVKMVWPMTQTGQIPFYWPKFHKPWIVCGWCWAFRKEDREDIFPIDERVKIRYNDHYLFNRVKELWDYWILDMVVHHFGSATISKLDISEQAKRDHENWKKICEEKWWTPRIPF